MAIIRASIPPHLSASHDTRKIPQHRYKTVLGASFDRGVEVVIWHPACLEYAYYKDVLGLLDYEPLPNHVPDALNPVYRHHNHMTLRVTRNIFYFYNSFSGTCGTM